MNEIQEKENILAAASASAESRLANVKAAQRQVRKRQIQFQQAVVDAGLASEKLRRKRNFLVTLIGMSTFAAASLIAFLINLTGGILFFSIVGIVALLWQNNNAEANKIEYYKRRDFFARYAHVVPAGETLKWKDSSIRYTGPLQMELEYGEWECPFCKAVNEDGNLFCIECGVKRAD